MGMNRDNVSQIMVTTNRLEYGLTDHFYITYDYEWVDITKRFAMIQVDLLETFDSHPPSRMIEGQIFALGQLRLQAIEYDAIANTWFAQRVTRFSWYWYLKHRLSNKWHVFTRRLLWTAVVWGLADRPSYGMAVTSNDLKMVKWFKKRRQ